MKAQFIGPVLLALLAGCQQPGSKTGHEATSQASASMETSDTNDLAQALKNADEANRNPVFGTNSADDYEGDGSVLGDDQANLDSAGGGEYKASAPFKAERDRLQLQMINRLLSACIGAKGREGLAACYHERLLAGFDERELAKSNCPLQEDIKALGNCIIVGVAGYKLAEKAGADTLAAFDWTDPKGSVESAMRQLVLMNVRECLANGSPNDPKECVNQRMMKVLDLSEEDVEPCTPLRGKGFELGRCISDAFGLKYLAAGIARM